MRKRSNVSFFILIICAVMTVFTCKQSVGLGPQVDVVPPGGKITYPGAGASPIRGSFVLKGTAEDDDGVESVSVVFENTETKIRTGSFGALLSNAEPGRVNWEIPVYNESTGTVSDHPLVKLYPIPDGEYTAIVTVTDKGGKTYETRHTYKIDNTPPVFIASRPSLSAVHDAPAPSADGYGAVMKIIGSAADMHELSSITLTAGDPGDPITITKKNKENVVDIVMASAADPLDPASDYAKLLTAAAAGGTTEAGKDKPLKAVITLEDNARTYNGSGGTKGNESAFYYIKNEIEGLIDLNKYTAKVISDYFSGKKGKNGGTPHEQAIYDLRNDTAARNVLLNNRITPTVSTDPSEPAAKKCVFALNPDKSPGFKVVGADPILPTGGTTTPAEMYLGGASSSLTVELYPNRDGNALVSGTDYAASGIKIELYKGSITDLQSDTYINAPTTVKKTFFDATNPAHLTSGIQKNGDIIKITKPLTGLEADYYRIIVTGHDVQGNNTFVPYNTEGKPSGGYLIVKFRTAGQTYIFPRQLVNEYQNRDFDIFCTVQSLAGGSVYYAIDTDPGTTPPTDTNFILTQEGTSAVYKGKAKTDTLTEGAHTVKLRAKGTNGTADAEIKFVFDKTPPQAAVLTAPSTASKPFPLYSYTFKGTAQDTDIAGYTNPGPPSGIKGSGIEKVMYKVGTKTGGTPNYGAETPARLSPPSSSSAPYTWEAVVSFSEKENNYVWVTVYDKAGNKKTTEFGPYKVNTDSPQIDYGNARFSLGTAYNESSSGRVYQNQVIGNNAKRKASFKILAKNEFGIKTVKISVGSGAEKTGLRQGTTVNSDGYEEWRVNDVDLVEGNPTFKVYVESKSGDTGSTSGTGTITEWQIPIIVDFTVPEIKQTSPDLDNVYYQKVDLIGSIVDKIASGIPSGADRTTVKYKIANSDFGTSHSVGGIELSRIDYTGGPWTISIPDIAKYKDVSGVIAPPSGSSIYKVPVQIQVSDMAGNSVTSEQFMIKFDPDGGAPFVELNNPKQNAAFGGDILISGSTRVANPASGVTVKEIYLQLGQTQLQLESNTPWNLAGKDYGAANGVKIYPASGTDDVYSWSYVLPETVKTAILSGAQSKEVWLRVKAKNSSGSFGDWTPARKFTINTDVAQFTAIQLKNGSSLIGNYSPNSAWIKGDSFKITGSVSHSAGIKEKKAESPEQLPPGYEQLDTTGSSSWFTASGSPSSTSYSNYTFEIPIKTSHYAKQAGNIQFNISATDGRALGTAVTVSYPIMLRYDNTLPAVAMGKDIVKSENTSFVAGKFTPREALDAAKKDLYRVLVADKVYEIQTIAGTNVTLKNASTLSGTFDYGIVERPKMIFDDGSDYQITGIASDTGSGVSKVVAKLEVVKGSTHTVSVTMTRTDSGNKITRERGDMVSFKGSLNTEGVPNGKGRLTITAYDESGNETSETITDIIVKNKPIEIKKIVFKTDLSGNNAYESNEEYEVTNMGVLNSERDFIGVVNAASDFTFKNPTKSELTVTLKGGYGNNARVSLHKEGSTSGTIGDEITYATGTISAGEYTVTLDLNGKLGIGDSPNKKLILKVTDESIGTPPASSPVTVPYWHAQANIEVGLDVTDDVAPRGFIMPLFYNSDEGRITRPDDLPLVSVVYDVEKTAGVITAVKEPLGHIQLAPVSGLSNTHPSVSGKVRLRGIAYDNIRLKELKLSGPGINETATFTAGAWSNGNLKVVKNELSNTGHYVEWEYEWTTGTPAKAQKITLTVKDERPNTSAASAAPEPSEKTGVRSGDRALILAEGDKAVKHQFIRLYMGDKSYLVQIKAVESIKIGGQNKTQVSWDKTSVPEFITKYKLYTDTSHSPDLTVNIVPYIMKIETALSELGGENDPDLYARTALGRYPVRDGETIKVYGFNLNGAAATVGGGASGSLSGSESPWNLTVASTAKSGKLELTVGSGTNAVSAINNGNNTSNDKPYNSVPKTANNNKLTDDVELDVWQFNSEAALPVRGAIAEPVMRINPVNGMIGFAFANGPDYFSMSMGQSSSYEKWHRNTDDFRHIDFVYDKNGVSHGVVTAQDQNSQSEQASNLAYITSKWGHPGTPQGGSNYSGNNALRLEKIGQAGKMDGSGGDILDKNRIENPSLVAVNDAGTDTRLYLAYYDGINDQIRFKAGTLTAAMDWNYIRGAGQQYKKNDGSTSNVNIEAWKAWKKVTIPGTPPRVVEYIAKLPVKPFGQFVDQEWRKELTKYNQDNVSIVAGKYMQGTASTDTGNKTGRYLSLGVVPGPDASKDVAVLIWFDERSKKLKYTYNKYPAKEDTSGPTAPNPPPGMIDPSGDPEIQDLKFDSPTIPPRHFGTGTGDGYWNTAVKNVFKDANIGEYCKMVVDKNGGIHIAAYNFATASLHYAYLSSYTVGSFKTSVVDSYGITGSDIRLDVAMSASGKPIPYIGYYSASAGCAKLAYLVEPDSGFDQGAAGVESGYFTGKWEVTCIPTESRVEKDNINVAVWKDANGTIKNSATGTSSSNTTSGKVYGNGTSNPVLGYAIRKATEGYIETAQKK